MSKIICDVCGTSYPDTATQCPICGCVRTADNKSVPSRAKSDKEAEYTYVKGGRFSKSNVKKRNKASGVVSVNVVKDGRGGKKSDSNSNRGLVATVIILLLAIVAVALYITFRYFVPVFSQPAPAPSIDTTPTEITEATVPCDEVELDFVELKLDKVGDTQVLTATVTPGETTDVIEFISADEKVATVEVDGNEATVTAVAPGKTMIIVKCGAVKASCTVECVGAEEETTESTIAIPEGAVLELNRSDMTLSRVGETWDLKKGNIPAEAITWKSDNPNVVSVENGIVKAVSSGMTTIHAECNDQKVSCIVRCNFSSSNSGVSGSGGGISEDG